MLVSSRTLFFLLPILSVLAQETSVSDTTPIETTPTTISDIIDIPTAVTESISTPAPETPVVTESNTTPIEITTSSTSTAELPSTTTSFSGNATITGEMPSGTEVVIEGVDQGEPDDAAFEVTVEDSMDTTAYQLNVYAEDLVNGEHETIIQGDTQAPPVVIPSCPDVSATTNKTSKRSLVGKRVYNCAPPAISIDVHFHYVSDVEPSESRLRTVRTRIEKNVELLREVMGAYKVNMRWDGNFTKTVDSEFANHEKIGMDTIKQEYAKSRANSAFMKKTRVGGAEDLNVWIVKDIKSGTKSPAGYAYFPGMKLFERDGVVVVEGALTTTAGVSVVGDDACEIATKVKGSTLVHEFGHWMGLRHVFEGGCSGNGDNVADSFHYPSSASCCRQVRCGRSSENRVENWMSYSPCRGTYEGQLIKYRAFTPGQKAEMYAHFLTFRRKAPCNAKYTAKRDLGGPEVLYKRAEEKATILAELLLQNCSVAIQDVFVEDSIPLAQSVLQSYSVAASSLQANPTAKPTDVDSPGTATLGAGVATKTGSEAEATGKKNAAGSGKIELRNASTTSMLGIVGWMLGFFWVL